MANKLSYIKERVLFLAKLIGENKKEFIENIGQTYGNFTGVNQKRPLNSDTIHNILSKYPVVNVEWLLTGSGTPLKEKVTENEAYLVQEIAKQEQRIEHLELKVDALNMFILKNFDNKKD